MITQGGAQRGTRSEKGTLLVDSIDEAAGDMVASPSLWNPLLSASWPPKSQPIPPASAPQNPFFLSI
jgi:hypothetical protein